MHSLISRLNILFLTGTSILGGQNSTMPPGEPLLPVSALPDYEKNIDHAGYIKGFDKQTLSRGNETYQQVCYNCHGDLILPGSIPNSLRFAEGKFQHGNDPYTMYETVTRGWRLMAPQIHLSPQEKYEVIHYIREKYIRNSNPSEYFNVTDDYLAGLPKGTSRGPKPVKREPWKDFNYGDFLINTYELIGSNTLPEPVLTDAQMLWAREGNPLPDTISPNANFAYKGIAIRLDKGEGGIPQGRHFIVFDHDTLRVAGAWSGKGFIDWNGIHMNGRHNVHPKTLGDLQFELPDGPGWANPATGNFEDQRIIGLDGMRYGPLPRSWGKYRGLYHFEDRVVVSYSVGDASILESYRLEETDTQPVFVRVLNIGKSSKDLLMRVAKAGIRVKVSDPRAVIDEQRGLITLNIPVLATPLNLELFLAKKDLNQLAQLAKNTSPENLTTLTKGGPGRWPQQLPAIVVSSNDDGGFAWDRISRPLENPWKSQLRSSGVDFSPDGQSAYVCCWDGEVWKVDGIDADQPTITWRRIAAGLFQPLGIKVVDDQIYITCRDQLVVLRDLNNDGETDFYEAVNSDHQVTEHFHEFAMGLQVDEKKNFYYAKSARHAKSPLVPQHGTLIKVTADGSKSEIIAHGFRAANGVCRNPDGTFIVTDQEGHWNPMNRLNWVNPGNRFYGNMYGYGAPDDSSNSAMEKPLTWVEKTFDRSPSELLWVDSESWGPLNGKLLNLSYGHGRLELVPHESIKGQVQGGMIRLSIPDLPTGIMRGRFHPNGHLYVCGMSAWGTDQMDLPGGFYRIRATGKPVHLPIELNAYTHGIELTFSDPLDPSSTRNPANFSVKTWELKRSATYGSDHYNTKSLDVTSTKLSKDGKILSLTIPNIEPVWQMEIHYELKSLHGDPVIGTLQNTIHNLRGTQNNLN